jgi:RNA polymerase sigma-70 factor, ECF subfamily
MATDDQEPTEVLVRVETFDAFYRRHYRGVVALVLALSGNPGTAEDIAQDAMVVTYRRWDEVCAYDDPTAWVRRVAVNRATSLGRRRLAEMRAVIRLAGRREPLPAMPQPDEQLWAEVRRLPRRQGQCVALHYLLDCSVEETARTLGCAEGTVKAHLFHARATLASRLGVPDGAS